MARVTLSSHIVIMSVQCMILAISHRGIYMETHSSKDNVLNIKGSGVFIPTMKKIHASPVREEALSPMLVQSINFLHLEKLHKNLLALLADVLYPRICSQKPRPMFRRTSDCTEVQVEIESLHNESTAVMAQCIVR